MNYSLTGWISHKGSPSGGNYYPVSVDKEGSYTTFDDNKTPISEADIHRREPSAVYIACYCTDQGEAEVKNSTETDINDPSEVDFKIDNVNAQLQAEQIKVEQLNIIVNTLIEERAELQTRAEEAEKQLQLQNERIESIQIQAVVTEQRLVKEIESLKKAFEESLITDRQTPEHYVERDKEEERLNEKEKGSTAEKNSTAAITANPSATT